MSRCILGAPNRANPWPRLSAGAQDRFAGSETERKPQRGESQGWDEQPECILKYMRIPSTAGTRDPERSRFFHKLLGSATRSLRYTGNACSAATMSP
ncbi:MAG: hypothetical protein USCGTAYLOR_02393 [Chromatiales bacterium USCg_Taylor]|nr:MAG: hypothetical protein USCGTAYLOR_02393 [Chromatiales bacterium USCg_Taylor]